MGRWIYPAGTFAPKGVAANSESFAPFNLPAD